MFRNLVDQRGYALVTVIMVMVVLIILGTSLLSIALSDTKMAVYQESSMKAYFIARSGAYALADHLIKNPEAIAGIVAAGESEEVVVADGSFTLDVTQVGSEINIKSTGHVRGVSQEVSVVLSMSAGSMFDYAIVSDSTLNLTNHVKVEGLVATNSNNINSVTTANGAVPQQENVQLDAGFEFKPIQTPHLYDHEFTHTITSADVITLSGETHIYAKEGIKLSPSHNHLNIQGTGDLHLYVEKEFDIHNHCEIINSNGSVYIYILDGSDVDIRGSIIEAIIYAPDSKVTFHNASGRQLYGTIIAKEVNVDGNHTIIEYNPNIDPDNINIEKTYKIKDWQ